MRYHQRRQIQIEAGQAAKTAFREHRKVLSCSVTADFPVPIEYFAAVLIRLDPGKSVALEEQQQSGRRASAGL